MKPSAKILNYLSVACILVAVVCFIAAVTNPRLPGDTDAAAAKVERILERRMLLLDELATRTELERIPGDMVIYRYENDTLKSWAGQFSVSSDDIDSKVVIQRIVNPGVGGMAPLSEIGDTVGFFNFGPKWYLARKRTAGKYTILEGLTIVNSLDTRSFSGNNGRLHLSPHFSIRPLSTSGGSEVKVDGKPQFKILYDSLDGTPTADFTLVAIALAFLIAAALCFLLASPGVRRFLIAGCVLLSSFAAVFVWGLSVSDNYRLFSPLVYADGAMLYSLGAVLLINLAITVFCAEIYIIRASLKRSPLYVVPLVSGIIIYSVYALRSIVLNSNICIELYKVEALSGYSFVVYSSFFLMLVGVLLITSLVMPKALSTSGRVIFATVTALSFIWMPAILGLKKESTRLEVWANRLAIDRDIALELQLLNVEKPISEDAILASLSVLANGSASIQNRLKETYFPRIAQDYDVSVIASPRDIPVIKSGSPISDNSRFLYIDDGSAHAIYLGTFYYDIPGYGLREVTIKIEQSVRNASTGYARLLGITPPGHIVIPSFYSYARFVDRRLLSFQGDFPYQTAWDDIMFSQSKGMESTHVHFHGYTHFSYRISDDEAVVISRPNITAMSYIVAFIIFWMVLFLAASMFKPARKLIFEKSYYRSRISWTLMVSLSLTLVVLTSVSVLYVYRRSENNRRSILSEKINAVQSMMSHRLRGDITEENLRSPEILSLIQSVGDATGLDITLYSKDGRVFMSTSPVAFESLQMGYRVNYAAFNSIINEGSRYFINREYLYSRSYYCVYAPLMTSSGETLAIICVPQVDAKFDFERDAAFHLVTILAVFLLLLLLSRFVSLGIVDRMFRPLSEMGRKMNAAGVGQLETIEYERDDEISSLVKAYNSMVVQLGESSRQLAQAERDKAWSRMARQVAHEIKNPLTPMKLQLQRLLRMKSKGVEGWEEKFDEVSKVILDHIEILTETANEFSTFAKLYTEEPAEIDLDTLLQEEISMFDSKGDVEFEYFGLDGAKISGPKPQLTRVFVNLINNAVQAVENSETRRICVSLRNSVTDGYYDIVFEDSGPGVSEENLPKLFSPNFTTKSGGSGLGLAISHSILDRCDATISYSKSFRLEGACFTIKYPKLI